MFFGRQNVHVVLYDEFKIDTCAVYTEVLRFMEVDYSHDDTDYPVINANRRARSIRVQELLPYPPQYLQGFARRALPPRPTIGDCEVLMQTEYRLSVPTPNGLGPEKAPAAGI